MTNYVVSSGFAEKTTLTSGDTMSVFDSGASLDVKVKFGGQEFVYAGGLASGSDVNGTLAVSAGGSSYAASIGYRGIETVASGGATYGTIVENSYEIVSAGGSESGTVIYAGFNTIQAGGTESGTFVYGGTDILQAGATATDTTVISGIFDIYGQATGTMIGYRGAAVIEQGATISGMIVAGGDGYQVVESGGIADATIVSGGGQYVSGGTASATVLLAYGYQTVVAGGNAVGTIISGGSAHISSGGTASGTKITSGGYEYVKSATIGRTSIEGGTLDLEGGSRETGPIVFSGAGGVLTTEGGNPPTAVISGFAAGDEINLTTIPYYTSAAASVEKVGIVTISAAAETIKLKMAGATVGETDFTVTSASKGLILGKTAAVADVAKMQFLSPNRAPAVSQFLTPAPAHAITTSGAVAKTSATHGMIRETAAKPDYATALILSATHG